jgi:hypothetical protein
VLLSCRNVVEPRLKLIERDYHGWETYIKVLITELRRELMSKRKISLE